jgi:hypothetical protein
MELRNAIQHIITSLGRDSLNDARLVNMLDDFKAFEEQPSAKYVLKSMIDDGLSQTLSKIEFAEPNNQIHLFEQLQSDLYSKKGFRLDVSTYIVSELAAAFDIGYKPKIVVSDNSTINAGQYVDDEKHISVFGMTLGTGITNFVNTLVQDGYLIKGNKPTQVYLTGDFAGIKDVDIYVNNWDKSERISGVVIRCPQLYHNVAKICQMDVLKKVFFQKYGTPDTEIDNYDYFLHSDGGVPQAIRYCETIYQFIWLLEGGKIELSWCGEPILITYSDTINGTITQANVDKRILNMI